jgi:dynein heavy chain
MTNEPPKGLKANLRNTYLSIPDDWFEASEKPATFKKLLFGLSFFHGVTQERRKFGPLGWNIPYEFNDTDYRISMRQLQLFIDSYDVTQWKALCYLAGQCNYGGRVTDDHDRRTLVSILGDYFRESMLDDNHRFSAEAYYAPKEGDKQSYLSHIESLPDHDDPLVFGMHRNAEITFARNETSALLGAVLSIQPATTGGGGKSADDLIDELAADTIAKVPQPFDMEAAAAKYPVMYEQSLNSVLVQELVRFNRLVSLLHSSLADLRKAVKGLVVMNNDLETLSKSLQDGQVPTMWAKVAYPSLKALGSWVADLLARLSFMQNWLDDGPPVIFWISGFFFTQSFLTGTLQNYARQQLIPIDMLTFDFEMLQGRPDVATDDGCHVDGLFIEGARFDAQKGALGESVPKVLFTAMPVIWLKVAQASTIGDRAEGFYECPIYRTLERKGTLSTTGHSTNFVMEMYLPSDKPTDHWVQRGVAMFCALDD